MYEMLTGRRAFRALTPAATMAAIVHEDPPDVPDVIPSTPVALARIIQRCLEKHPDQRFQSASDLAFDLESIAVSESSARGPVVRLLRGALRSRSFGWGLAGEVAIALLLMLALAGRRPAERSTFRSGNGESKSLAGHRGRVVLVNVWATWCAPCRIEMPELDRLQRDLGEHGLVVLHLSDEGETRLASFVEEHPTSAEHGRLDALPWPETGRPTTYLVDREGIVRQVVLGNRSYERFRALVERVL